MILQTTPKNYVLRRTDRGIANIPLATLGKFDNHVGETPNEKMFNMFRKNTRTQNAKR